MAKVKWTGNSVLRTRGRSALTHWSRYKLLPLFTETVSVLRQRSMHTPCDPETPLLSIQSMCSVALCPPRAIYLSASGSTIEKSPKLGNIQMLICGRMDQSMAA